MVTTVGSEQKATVAQQLGADVVINHKREADVAQAMARACPDKFEVIMDGVGGPLQDACIANLAPGGQIYLTGYIAEYPHNQGAFCMPFWKKSSTLNKQRRHKSDPWQRCSLGWGLLEFAVAACTDLAYQSDADLRTPCAISARDFTLEGVSQMPRSQVAGRGPAMQTSSGAGRKVILGRNGASPAACGRQCVSYPALRSLLVYISDVKDALFVGRVVCCTCLRCF